MRPGARLARRLRPQPIRTTRTRLIPASVAKESDPLGFVTGASRCRVSTRAARDVERRRGSRRREGKRKRKLRFGVARARRRGADGAERSAFGASRPSLSTSPAHVAPVHLSSSCPDTCARRERPDGAPSARTARVDRVGATRRATRAGASSTRARRAPRRARARRCSPRSAGRSTSRSSGRRSGPRAVSAWAAAACAGDRERRRHGAGPGAEASWPRATGASSASSSGLRRRTRRAVPKCPRSRVAAPVCARGDRRDSRSTRSTKKTGRCLARTAAAASTSAPPNDTSAPRRHPRCPDARARARRRISRRARARLRPSQGGRGGTRAKRERFNASVRLATM